MPLSVAIRRAAPHVERVVPALTDRVVRLSRVLHGRYLIERTLGKGGVATMFPHDVRQNSGPVERGDPRRPPNRNDPSASSTS